MASYSRRRTANTGSRVILGLLLVIPLVLLGGAGIVKGIGFTQDVGGRLKRAADANSIELAVTELQAALKGMEARGCTTGRSHVLWYTPACDVGFWYDNIETALAELVSFPKDADALTTSNQLMKLRETLLDDGSKGVVVTVPPNIVVFPNQGMWFVGGWIVIAAAIFGCGIAAVELDSRS